MIWVKEIKGVLVRNSAFVLSFVVFLLCANLSSPAQAESAGPSFQDCSNCPEMIPLNPARFWMGFDTGKRAERPAHWVDPLPAFAIARTETTYGQWAACVADGVCTPPQHDRGWGSASRPVIYVDYQQISSFLDWLRQKTGKPYRLPSEKEWEYAAHGGAVSSNRPRVTGKAIANCNKCTEGWQPETSPVASFAPNGFGLYDMLGNVMEWTSSCWTENHNPGQVEDCSKRVRRGGSWYFDHYVSTPTYRYGAPPDRVSYDVGFRVVVDLP